MSRTLCSILASILLVAGCAHLTGAATRLTNDLNDLAKMAHAIVEVKVLRSDAGPVNSAGLPTTIVRTQAIKTYKGDIATGAELQLEVLGGKQNGTTAVVPGQAEFEAGSHTVVLLTRVTGTERWRVVAGDAGQINFSHDENGRRMARRGSGKFEYYVSNPSSVTGLAQVSQVSIPRQQADVLLETIVSSGRPVIAQPPAQVPSAVLAAALPQSPAGASPLPMLLAISVLATLVYVSARRWIKSMN